jgi:penicillin-binding protein 1A
MIKKIQETKTEYINYNEEMNNLHHKYRKFTRIFWVIFFLPIVFLFALFALAVLGKLGYMPPIEDLENPKINLATLIISEDNQILGQYYQGNQNRTHVDFDRLPKNLVDAIIASEDIRFYKHSGVDIKGTLRAFFFLGKRGGGSTLTQQLAKQLFHVRSSNYWKVFKQKIKEYIIAVKLEKSYTKEEIIALYFNQYDFLNSAVGINSAAQIYFNKPPDSLKIEESAVLVGMAQNPSLFNPLRFPENALQKRNRVFGQMLKYDFITKKEYDSLKLLPIITDYQPVSHNIGPATYFREYIRKTMTRKKPIRKNYRNYSSYTEDSLAWTDDPLYGWCKKNKKADGSKYDIQTDGLKIYTTINYNMQLHAEEAVRKHFGGYLQPEFFKEVKGRRKAPFANNVSYRQIDKTIKQAIRNTDYGRDLYRQGLPWDSIYKRFKKPKKMKVFSYKGVKDTVFSLVDSILYYKHFAQCGFMSLDPRTGAVKAYVGGSNFRYFKFDHITQGKRQAGSTFKPFLYILAMEEGYTPCYEVLVNPIRFKDNDTVWEPRSTCRKEDLKTFKPLTWGLATSENYISAFLVSKFKPQPIADIAYKMGIESHIDPVPSMIYGTSDMSVKEMIGAFGTLANKGVHMSPIFVTRIEDKYGNILASFQPEGHEAISEETAYLMIRLMRGVVDYVRGTAHRLIWRYNMTAEIAGKTGTTNNNSDGWFIGITPRLVSGGWVGFDDPTIHFGSTHMGSGTNMALPIWAEYMMAVYNDSTLDYSEDEKFEAPPGFHVNLNCKDPDKSSQSTGSNQFDYGLYEDDGF